MKNSQKAAFAMSLSPTDKHDGVLQEGLTKREYACIKLGVPETGDSELDGLIRKAERKQIAAMAMNGFLANTDNDEYHLGEGQKTDSLKNKVALCMAFADELLKQLDNERQTTTRRLRHGFDGRSV